MILGWDMFADSAQSTVFNTLVGSQFDYSEFKSLDIDEIYVKNENITPAAEKNLVWGPQTVFVATFDSEDLEAGTLILEGEIDKVLVDRREVGRTQWHTIAEILPEAFTSGENTIVEFYDYIIANDVEYEYSVVPIQDEVRGGRAVMRNPIRSDFEGVFISDLENNFHLLHNTSRPNITHNLNTTLIEPIEGRYPYVIYGNKDYQSLPVSGLHVSSATIGKNGQSIPIHEEKLSRDIFTSFLKNKKPKIYRDIDGHLILVARTDNVVESSFESLYGLYRVDFSLVEIGNATDINLRNNGLMPEIGV